MPDEVLPLLPPLLSLLTPLLEMAPHLDLLLGLVNQLVPTATTTAYTSAPAFLVALGGYGSMVQPPVRAIIADSVH